MMKLLLCGVLVFGTFFVGKSVMTPAPTPAERAEQSRQERIKDEAIATMKADNEKKALADIQEVIKAEKKQAEANVAANEAKKKGYRWYEGGTLKGSLGFVWKNAPRKDRVGTTADFLWAYAANRNYPIASKDALKYRVIQLEKCVTEAVGGTATDMMPVDGIFDACVILTSRQ